MADKRENEFSSMGVASLIRCLDNAGNSGNISVDKLLGTSFRVRAIYTNNSDVDVDYLQDMGVYLLNNGKQFENTPPGETYGYLLVFSPVKNIALQFFISPQKNIYRRLIWAQEWSEWVKI